jgi:hypothetical protein
VRVVDALAVRKDAEGNVTKLHESQLSDEETAAFGAVVGALIGLGAAGEEGMAAGAELGAATVEERGGVFNEDDAWDALAEIPEDTAALLVLLEHRFSSLRRSGGHGPQSGGPARCWWSGRRACVAQFDHPGGGGARCWSIW